MSWLTETMIATTVLMLAALALRGPVARLLGARVAYLLWLAPALRMILPPVPAEWLGDAAAMPISNAQLAPDFADVSVAMVSTTSPAPLVTGTAGGDVAWPMIALLIWLGGAALFLLWHCLAYRSFRAKVMDGADYLDADRHIPVARSSAVSSPIAMGIFGRAVIVPADFNHRFDATEQRLALDHEMAHHTRWDLVANFAALVMLALHWFNPIAHIAHRAFRLDQEAACDALVLEGASQDERHAYGTALFKSATAPMPLTVCAMGTATQLKSRLRMIAAGIPGRLATRAGMMAAACAVLAGLGISASIAAADTKPSYQPGTGTVIKGDKLVWQDPKEMKPRMIALNGVEIDPSDAPAAPLAPEAPDAPTAPPATAAWPEPPAAPATMTNAERARAAAEAEAEQAQQEADRALERAEAARERAEAARERANAAAEAAADAEADAADLISDKDGVDVTVACKKAKSRHVMSSNSNGHRLAVVVCDKAIATYTNARTAEALKQARSQIAAMPELTPAMRAKALEGLDKAIARERVKSYSLQ